MNLFLVIEFDLVDVFEDLFQMRLDCRGFLGLRQDLEEFIVGEEIKSRELFSFFFQIIVQFLLDDFEGFVSFFKLIEKTVFYANNSYAHNLFRLAESVFPSAINRFELFSLLR